MRRISSTLTAVCAATLLTASVAGAQGTVPDRKTNVTFSGPVSVPGATLPAGTYVFKLADSPVDRHIVMIFDRDESKLITTLLAVPAERPEAHGDAVVNFKETPSDRPPAVHYWYYAGEKAGNEFIYPRAQAMMIAQASGESVSAFDTDSTDINAWKSGKVSNVSSTSTNSNSSSSSSSTSAASTTSASTSTQAATSTMPEPAQSTPVTPAPAASTTSASSAASTAPTTTAPTTAPTTTAPEPVASTAPVTPEPTTAPAPAPTATAPVTSEPTPVGTSGRTELPRTASELPLVGLIGLFALAGFAGVRAARRSIA